VQLLDDPEEVPVPTEITLVKEDRNNFHETRNFEETILHVPDRLKFERNTESENGFDDNAVATKQFEAFKSRLMDNGAKYRDLYMKR